VSRNQVLLAALLLGASLAVSSRVVSANEAVLWSFDGVDGSAPFDTVSIDTAGNLYGTTIQGGTFGLGAVFELSPPTIGGGAWTESVLWNFGSGSDGASPFATVTVDQSGNLYGTTCAGGTYLGPNGGLGTVFKLSPPATADGSWTESILWNFGNGNDGSCPESQLLLGANGVLYGTTYFGGKLALGTVFRLAPPASGSSPWRETILWNFDGANGSLPIGRLIKDKAGNLYGTTGHGGTFGSGTAFKLGLPPGGGKWTEFVLWNFGNGTDGARPLDGLTMDASGNLYGTTWEGGTYLGGGTAFELIPPDTSGGSWTESILWDFGNGFDGANPAGYLLLDKAGNLYGTTQLGGHGGKAFRLKPPAISGDGWSESILWSFGGTDDSAEPFGGLLLGPDNVFYGTTNAGGASDRGTVFQLTN